MRVYFILGWLMISPVAKAGVPCEKEMSGAVFSFRKLAGWDIYLVNRMESVKDSGLEFEVQTETGQGYPNYVTFRIIPTEAD